MTFNNTVDLLLDEPVEFYPTGNDRRDNVDWASGYITGWDECQQWLRQKEQEAELEELHRRILYAGGYGGPTPRVFAVSEAGAVTRQ
jgi:hypothetical protein